MRISTAMRDPLMVRLALLIVVPLLGLGLVLLSGQAGAYESVRGDVERARALDFARSWVTAVLTALLEPDELASG